MSSNDKPEILIVDDSATIRASIAKFLGSEYITHTCENGEQGWEHLQNNENIALVFADMQMPVLNGMLLLQRIRQSDAERIASIPVIMITGREDSRAAKRAAHTIGATDFLTKPFNRVDILSRADSYTRLSNRIAEYNEELEINALTGLYNNRTLLDFGDKALGNKRNKKLDLSILYAEVVDIKELVSEHGNQISEQIIASIADILKKSLRKDELLSRIDDGKFVIVLPLTKAFKAHIIATRLKKAIQKVEFDISSTKVRTTLAIGLTSTDSYEDVEVELGFKEYCIQAAHALNMSLESSNHPIVRYDETYEKQFEAKSLTSPVEVSTVIDEDTDVDSSLEEFGEFFSSILIGDYSNIPQSYIHSLVTPMENFLEYARSLNGEQRKAG